MSDTISNMSPEYLLEVQRALKYLCGQLRKGWTVEEAISQVKSSYGEYIFSGLRDLIEAIESPSRCPKCERKLTNAGDWWICIECFHKIVKK